MKITAIINTHGKVDVTKDTIDSVIHYMTDQILVVADEANWHLFKDEELEASLLKGFYHNFFKAPYRNVILGISKAVEAWPDSDWYCYLEYDCLIGSSKFKNDLKIAEKNGIWCLANDLRLKEKMDLSLIELMLKTKFKEVLYFLGACVFYHRNFIQKALQEDFFEKFLFYTNPFKEGFFPKYVGFHAHDVLEHIMPTLVHHWGGKGKIAQFAKFIDLTGTWAGNYKRYPIRYQPELVSEEEYLWASVLHPVKDYDHHIREYHRKKRCR